MRSMVEGADQRRTKEADVDAPRDTVARARRLRRAMTPPELRLWSALRRRPDGLKFRRQHPFGPFVLDFYCDAARLGIEVDGLAHDLGDNPVRDRVRDAWLREHGIRVMRFPAEEVWVNLDGVVTGIVAAAAEHARQAFGPLHHPSRGPPPPEGEETRAVRGHARTDPRSHAAFPPPLGEGDHAQHGGGGGGTKDE